MTAIKQRGKQLLFPCLLLAIVFLLVFSRESIRFVKEGLSLSALAVIPALFPHLVLSDLLMGCMGGSGRPCSLLMRLRLPPCAPLVFAVGGLCGFPVGARLTGELAARGDISQDSAQDLAAFTCNTGPAFVLGAAGSALFGSVKIGAVLFAAEMLSALLCLLLTAPLRQTPLPAHEQLPERAVSFVEAVKRASQTCLFVCGFILFFSVICGFLRLFFPVPFPFLAPFLEVGNAAKAAAAVNVHAPVTARLIAVFSVSFGGLSAALQSALCLKEYGISFGGYLPRKLLQGMLSIVLFLLLTGGGLFC